jgi:Xaa-Pro aminopeptidase
MLRERWHALGGQLRSAGLRGLVVGGHGTLHRYGYLEYVGGYCPWQQDAYAVLSPGRPGRLLVQTAGDADEARWRGVPDVAFVPASQGGPVAAVAAVLSTWGIQDGAVGFVGRDIVSAADISALSISMPQIDLLDATEFLDRVKAVKHADEIRCMGEAAALADEGMRTFASSIRIGADARAVCAEVERALRSGGARETIVRLGTGPYFNAPTRSRPLASGELLSAYVEVLHDSGYWVEMMRLVALGDLDAGRSRLVQACIDVAAAAERALRQALPDTECLQEIQAAGRCTGYRLDGGCVHGVGLDDADLPRFSLAHPTLLQQGMVIAAHPRLVDDARSLGAVIGDTYLLSDTGAVRLSEFKEKVLWLH